MRCAKCKKRIINEEYGVSVTFHPITDNVKRTILCSECYYTKSNIVQIKKNNEINYKQLTLF